MSFLKDKILKGFGKALLTGMILIDLQKAFDRLDDENLLQILKPMYNGQSVHVANRPFVNVLHYQYVALFLISLFELKLGLHSANLS